MDIVKLFEMQKTLDERIVKEKGLEEHDLLVNKIFAMQVELCELANELPETFKHWSNKKNNLEKALKEYVDGLHFLISIGLEEGVLYQCLTLSTFKRNGLFEQLVYVSHLISNYRSLGYGPLFKSYLGLGEMLGFTREQIEQAYMEKNAVNHQRQSEGY